MAADTVNPLHKDMKFQFSGKAIEGIVGVVFGIVFLVIFNAFYDQIQFITRDFDQLRGIYNLSLIVGVIIQTSRIFMHDDGYRLGTDLVTNVFFVYIAYQFWVIFPFNTSVIGDPALWDNIFKLLIVVPPALSVLAMFASTVKLTTSGKK
jgi:hypothetical protein